MRPYMALSLQLKGQRETFQRATEDIELMMEGTSVRVVAVRITESSAVPVPVPEGDVPEYSNILVMGFIEGPDADYGNLNALDTEWGKTLVSILKDHHIDYESEAVN